MKLASSWQFVELSSDALQAKTSCISPDGRIFCTATRSSADFHTTENRFSIPLNLGRNDAVSCIASVYAKPWILCVGTSGGSLVFFTPEGKQFAVKVHNEAIIFLKTCIHRKGHFTEPFNVLLAQCPNQICLTVPISDILQKMANFNAGEVTPTKWKLSHNRSVDAVVIHSNLPSPIFSGFHKFPAVISVGTRPFISVDSIPIEQSQTTSAIVKKMISSVWKFVAGTTDEEAEEEQIPNARPEWEHHDQGRCAIQVCASEEGRWLAISDTQGRVSLVDAVFGHITRVIKGLRDAQTAWSRELLIVYTPFRGVLVMCSVPDGTIRSAVKVDKKGRLYQTMNENGEFHAVFVDSRGNGGLLQCPEPKKLETEKVGGEKYHFALPSFMDM